MSFVKNEKSYHCFYNTLREEYDRSFKVGLLGKLAKGAVKLAGKVVVTAHDPRKAGTEEQFIARNIENKVIDNISSKLLSNDVVDEEIDEAEREIDEMEKKLDEFDEDEGIEEYIVFESGGKKIMKTFKLVLQMDDGTKVWINVNCIMKMTKTREGYYYIYLINGEKYLIDHRTASAVESCFAG